MERRPPQQFSTIFGDVPDPHSHSEHQKKILVRAQNFLKKAPKNRVFSHFESLYRDSETLFRDSNRAGISRVKNSRSTTKTASYN